MMVTLGVKISYFNCLILSVVILFCTQLVTNCSLEQFYNVHSRELKIIECKFFFYIPKWVNFINIITQ